MSSARTGRRYALRCPPTPADGVPPQGPPWSAALTCGYAAGRGWVHPGWWGLRPIRRERVPPRRGVPGTLRRLDGRGAVGGLVVRLVRRGVARPWVPRGRRCRLRRILRGRSLRFGGGRWRRCLVRCGGPRLRRRGIPVGAGAGRCGGRARGRVRGPCARRGCCLGPSWRSWLPLVAGGWAGVPVGAVSCAGGSFWHRGRAGGHGNAWPSSCAALSLRRLSRPSWAATRAGMT